MGRRLRANIPVQTSQLIPDWKHLPDFRCKNASFKERQKRDFDRHHAVRNSPSIPSDTPVWIISGDDPVPGRVVSPANTSRSYVVDTLDWCGEIDNTSTKLNHLKRSEMQRQTQQEAPFRPDSVVEPLSVPQTDADDPRKEMWNSCL